MANCLVVGLIVITGLIKVITCEAIPQAPASAPALPNIPGLSSIVDDLMKVVEKAKSRWDALQNSAGGLSLTNLLFPNRKRGPSRADSINKLIGGQKFPFQAFMDNEINSYLFPLPYQFNNEKINRRNGQLTNPPNGALFVPKNAAPSMKLIHRPATPVSNCLYGKTGTLCQDLSNFPSNEDQKQWEDLFSNVQLTEY